MKNWSKATCSVLATLCMAMVAQPALAAGPGILGGAPARVEPYTQPATAVQDVPLLKLRPLSSSTVVTPVRIALGALPLEKWHAAHQSTGGARQVGAARAVAAAATPAALQQRLSWLPAAQGGQVAAVSVSAQDAHGLRLGVLVQQLPGSARVRIYSGAQPNEVFEISGQAILQTLEANVRADGDSNGARTWWSPDVSGDEATLEIEVPAGTPAQSVQIAIPVVSHIFENLSLPTEEEFAISTKINESASCELDSTCYDEYASQRNATARMLFVEDGGTYVCTGTLLNDKDSSGTPYFLTANHCISSQTSASTLRTDWFYRSPSCNSRTLSSSSARRTDGSTMLYASAASDVALLRLNSAPPAGAVFAGWDANTPAQFASVVGVHHPKGDLQKVSMGNLNGTVTCDAADGTQFKCYGSTGMNGDFYNVGWSQGTVEGGSSGSGLFNGKYVVGTLYGGNASCTAQGGVNIYGRFDRAFATALSKWLAPSTTSPAVGARTAVYRFYNARTGAHFYTASAAERDFVIQTFPEFGYENIAFYAYADASSGKDPVFRFYNATSGAHFYSGSVAERDFVINTFPEFRYEVVSWYAQTAAGNGAAPIYRFYNAKSGAHFYTISAAERDFVIAVHKDFGYEGPMYFAWTGPQ